MKLSKSAIKDRQVWENAGIELPEFNIDKMQAVTKEPMGSFGAGNIFRGFIAVLQQKVIGGQSTNRDSTVETYDHEIIDSIYEPYDNLSLLVLMEPEDIEKKVVASVSESLVGDFKRGALEKVRGYI